MKVQQLHEMGNRHNLFRKSLLIMKMTVAIMLFACLHTYADGFSQKRITIKLESAELKQALQQIEKKSQYRFLYNQSVVKHAGKVSINANNELLVTVLNEMFEGTGISYRVMDGELIVLALGDEEPPAPQTIRGKITDADGKPIAGASIMVRGTKTGTAADAEGNFSITVPDGAVLVISAVNFVTQEITTAGRTNFDIRMTASTSGGLNEVVVIGYGTASKRDITGSIAKVQGKEVADKPNTNPVSSLQGKVAGLSVVNSGVPGQEPDIRIRGTNSIGGIKPLYVVDGIFNDNIDYINPNDIESIEILKDPSSLAIFGVRGANGVIAITTKKAKSGQLTVNFNTSFGMKKLVDKISMVNADEFKMLFDEEQTNIGVPTNERFNYAPWTGNTDWVGALTHTGIFSASNLSVASSTEKNKFYMGVGYTVDQGVILHQQLEKWLINLSDELRVSKSIRLGFNVNGINQTPPFSQANGLLYDARRVLPITPTMDPSGKYYTELAIQAAQIGNPLMNLENKYNKELKNESRMVGSVFAEISFLKHFTWKSTLYGDMSMLSTRTYNPIIYTWNPSVGGASGSVYVDKNNRTTSVNQNSERWNKYQQDHILNYKNSFGDHNITAVAGFTTYFSGYTGLYGTVKQAANGDSIPDNSRFWYIDNGFGDASTKRSSSSQWEKTTVSGLIRGMYNYKNKYYLNASYRRDGSSQISPANRYKNFYSVGAAWELTKEGFMKDQQLFDFMKLRASWGILGVQNTYGFDYPFYPALQTGNTAVFGNNIAPAYALAYTPNPNLSWETVDAREVGLEFNAFKNRLHFDAAYYNKDTKDVMTLVNDGTGRQRLDNVGEVKNHGFEAAASWSQSLSKDMAISIGANITTFHNEVVYLGGDKIPASEERPNQTEAGYPIGYFYGYVVEGLYQSYADKLNSPKVSGYEYGPGDFKYKDINGDGVINTQDRTKIGNPTPDFIYGFNATLNYKGFDFGADFNGSYGNEVYRYWGSSELPFTTFNYPSFKLNRWHGEGTSNWDPILGANHTINRLPSTYGIEDGSYFRIRNLQIGYNFPSANLAKAHIKNLRLYANAQNLITWKHNSGYTAEFGGTATSFGIDNGNGPLPMVITGGLNVTF